MLGIGPPLKRPALTDGNFRHHNVAVLNNATNKAESNQQKQHSERFRLT